MEMLTHAISWFEIPVTDFARAKKFYSTIYDYEMPERQMGPFLMGFLLSEQGGIGGAICQGEDLEPSDKGSKIYLNGGSDLNTVLNRVEAAGGAVLVPKTDIGEGFGFYAGFKDTEGNVIYLHSMQ